MASQPVTENFGPWMLVQRKARKGPSLKGKTQQFNRDLDSANKFVPETQLDPALIVNDQSKNTQQDSGSSSQVRPASKPRVKNRFSDRIKTYSHPYLSKTGSIPKKHSSNQVLSQSATLKDSTAWLPKNNVFLGPNPNPSNLVAIFEPQQEQIDIENRLAAPEQTLLEINSQPAPKPPDIVMGDKEKVLHFLNQALTEGSFPLELARAHITLIPKKEIPIYMADFRPITLLNTVYKILSKALVNRLRPLLQNLVGPLQSSFLPGRGTSDNIVITQEAVHSLMKRKGRVGGMILKIDLHKAYDSVSWEFLEQVLVDFNFPRSLIKLIMFCVSANNLSVICNGEAQPFFAAQRGLRQGDPLSPYLFILCMEKLSHMIQDQVHKKRWKPVKIARTGPPISHLFLLMI